MMFSATSFRRLAAAAVVLIAAGGPALAAGKGVAPPMHSWTFSGPFGTYDDAQLQRGFKVFQNVCAACHGLSSLSFRNLAEVGGPGFTPEQVAQLASSWPLQVRALNEQGESIERAPRPADRFPNPFPNKIAAAAANNGKAPPDLSVMALARTYQRGFPWFIIDAFTMYDDHGADYLRAFLVGYQDPPAGEAVPDGTHYNKYYPGYYVAMPNVLTDGQVEYTDGTPQTAAQYAEDVTAFLMWAADPHLEARHRIGLQVMIFLLVFGGLLYFTKKRIWSKVKEQHA